jgi:glutamine phosphoribosylpyrophosphate amidotransferase
MCGIFGIISKKKIHFSDLKFLAMHARQRGKDSSGYLEIKNNDFYINRFNYDLKYSIKKIDKNNQTFIGHARLVTNSMVDNQPIYKNDIALFHNGIITNFENLFRKYNLNKNFSIDTEIIIELFNFFFLKNKNFDKTIDEIFSNIIGTASCAMYLFSLGKLILFSNNGSLYTGQKNEDIYFSSEKFPLKILNCQNIFKVNKYIILDVPSCHKRVNIKEDNIIKNDLGKSEFYIPS